MRKGNYPSSNGCDTIVYYVYEPEPEACGEDGRPKAIVQISHGMCEYLERYADFAAFLNGRGILVCGNDHLGHGESARSPEDFGYFAKRDGWRCLAEDIYRLTARMQEEYPGVPYFLLGHSMGSFVARAYLSKYGDLLSGAILMGTCGRNKTLPALYPILAAMRRLRGDRYRSQRINDIAFGSYNAKFKPHRTEHDWISSDESVVDSYNADPRCTFIFTLGGFADLFHLIQFISRKEWASEVSADLPVILMSGALDPVGDRGKGVKAVHDELAFAGLRDLIIKLYPECRHELINERDRELVYRDILRWLEKRIGAAT